MTDEALATPVVYDDLPAVEAEIELRGISPLSLTVRDVPVVVDHAQKTRDEFAALYDLIPQMGEGLRRATLYSASGLSYVLFFYFVRVVGDSASLRQGWEQIKDHPDAPTSFQTVKKRNRIYNKFREHERETGEAINPIREFPGLKVSHFYKNLDLEPKEYFGWLHKAQDRGWDAEELEGQVNKWKQQQQARREGQGGSGQAPTAQAQNGDQARVALEAGKAQESVPQAQTAASYPFDRDVAKCRRYLDAVIGDSFADVEARLSRDDGTVTTLQEVCLVLDGAEESIQASLRELRVKLKAEIRERM